MKLALIKIDKIISGGAAVFDYVVKTSKFVALFLGAGAATYVVKELPNRPMGEPIAVMAERGFNKFVRDGQGLVDRTLFGRRPCPPKSVRCEKEKAKKVAAHTDAVKTALTEQIIQKQNEG